MRFVKLITVLAAALLAGAVNAVPAQAIANGINAAPGQFPFAVRLVMTNIPRPDGTSYNSACSAALISPTWVITAGHCFHDVNRNRVGGPVPYPTSATVNTNDVTQNPGEVRDVVSIAQSSSTDVALAKVSAPVTDVSPLALSQTKPATATILTAAGWGATSSVSPSPSTVLRYGRMKISSVRTSWVYVTGYAPSTTTSACLYDSGAPYFSTPASSPPKLVSVESDGPDCPHSTPETTARTDNIVSWIKTVATDLPH